MASTLPPTPTTSSAKRDMSYRKPVPVFVPSPPTSPGATTSEIEDELATEEEIPPLPANWREVLNARILEAKSSRVSVATRAAPRIMVDAIVQESDITEVASLPDTLVATPNNTPSPLPEDQASLAVSSASATPSIAAQKLSTRGLPTQYRPPTPPLRSQSKLQLRASRTELTYEDTATHYRMRRMEGGVYPPWLSNGGPRGPNGAPSLKVSPSFRTEKTMLSMSTGGPSGGPWSRSFGTLAEGGVYNNPAAYKKQAAMDVLSLSDHPESDIDDSSSCCVTRAMQSLATLWSSK